ncbi:hypothetical protein D9M72_547420 [compost metagenome]
MSVVHGVETAVGQEREEFAIRSERRRRIAESSVGDVHDPEFRIVHVNDPETAARPKGCDRFGPAQPGGVRRPAEPVDGALADAGDELDGPAPGISQVDVAEGGTDGKGAPVRAGLYGTGPGGLGEIDLSQARGPGPVCLHGRAFRHTAGDIASTFCTVGGDLSGGVGVTPRGRGLQGIITRR